MIGLGTWEAKVNTMFYKGSVKVNIFDNGGEYGFEVFVPDFDVPDINVVSVEEEDSHITAVVTTSVLPGKEITLDVDIEDDFLTGFVKIPFLGKVKLTDCRKIA